MQTAPSDMYRGTEMAYGEGMRGWSKKFGWDVTGAEYSIASRNPELKITRRSRDLGYVNGWNPIQELFKGLYVATTLMTAGKYALPEEEDAPMNGEAHNEKLSDQVGGIDLNPNNMDLQNKGQGINFNIPINAQTIQNMQFDGVEPFILQIIPTNLNVLLGLAQQEPEEALSYNSK